MATYVNVPLYISCLPTEVVALILSHVSIIDKVNLAKSILPWERALYSQASWRYARFNIDAHYVEKEGLYEKAIEVYGKYFQRLIVQSTHGLFWENYLRCLQFASSKCSSLKTLCIVHPKSWAFPSNAELNMFAACLKEIAGNNAQLKQFSLSLSDYSPRTKTSGVEELIKELENDSQVVNIMDKIELSHKYSMLKPFQFLERFRGLRKLKCQIHNLSTKSIESLLSSTGLRDLVVINDEHTEISDWSEDECINWLGLCEKFPQHTLRVHYHIKFRNWHSDNFVINPYMHSLILECFPVSSYLDIIEMCNIYSESLHVFMLLSMRDLSPLSEFVDEDELCFVPAVYGALVHSCNFLHTFASTVPIPAAAVLTIAANKKLHNIWIPESAILYTTEDPPKPSLWSVDEEVKVDWWKKIVKDKSSLTGIVSKFLGWSWKPQESSDIDSKMSSVTEIFVK